MPSESSKQAAVSEDRKDLEAFEKRASEPELTYEELLKDLAAHGKR